MASYRAIRSSYGFRNRFWEQGDVAENVTESEKIPEHFERIPPGVSKEVPKHRSFEPPEPATLSELQGKTLKHDSAAERR